MSGSHHPPGTLILEPQVVITTGQSGAVQVKRAYQTLPQYPIAYPGMCPPHQQNAGPPATTYTSTATAVDPLKYAFQSWLPNQPVSINTVQAQDLPGNYFQQNHHQAANNVPAVGHQVVVKRETKRQVINRMRMRETRDAESDGARTARLSVDRERARRTRSTESPDERERRLRLGRERAKRKRHGEDGGTREARLKKNREAARHRRASEAMDVRVERLGRNREQARYRRATEDNEHKRDRQARERERVRIKRMNETPEAKAERRRREMEKKRLMRGIASTPGAGSSATSPSLPSGPTTPVGIAAAAAAAAVLGDRKFLIPQVTTVTHAGGGGHSVHPPMNLIGHFEAFVNGQQQQQ